MTEKQLTRIVSDLAKLFGWKRYHTFLSRHSEAGFPDEILVRGSRLVVAELKSERGRLTEGQRLWLDVFRAVPSAEVFVWTPDDVEQIAEVLR